MKNLESTFELGQVVTTAGVYGFMQKDSKFKQFCFEGLQRHAKGDWGDVSENDKKLNDSSLVDGGRLLSVYEYEPDKAKKIWIITESDRSSTTILFPVEY